MCHIAHEEIEKEIPTHARLEDYPGFTELSSEQAVECKRLEALY